MILVFLRDLLCLLILLFLSLFNYHIPAYVSQIYVCGLNWFSKLQTAGFLHLDVLKVPLTQHHRNALIFPSDKDRAGRGVKSQDSGLRLPGLNSGSTTLSVLNSQRAKIYQTALL